MADPTAYVAAKISAAVGGLFGGLALMSYMTPKTIKEAFVRGGVSVGCAIVFAGPAVKYIGLTDDWEIQLMSGAICGFLGFAIMGAVANFLIKHNDKDIFELAKTVKKSAKK